MQYFKVINPNDLQIINPKTNWVFISRELYTKRELEKLEVPEKITFFNSKSGKHETIETESLFQKVSISKFQTYFFFGARFEKY
jgi:hypothetical protein